MDQSSLVFDTRSKLVLCALKIAGILGIFTVMCLVPRYVQRGCASEEPEATAVPKRFFRRGDDGRDHRHVALRPCGVARGIDDSVLSLHRSDKRSWVGNVAFAHAQLLRQRAPNQVGELTTAAHKGGDIVALCETHAHEPEAAIACGAEDEELHRNSASQCVRVSSRKLSRLPGAEDVSIRAHKDCISSVGVEQRGEFAAANGFSAAAIQGVRFASTHAFFSPAMSPA